MLVITTSNDQISSIVERICKKYIYLNEYEEGYQIMQDLSQVLDSGLKIVENEAWKSSGKYLFSSYMILQLDDGTHIKVEQEMFGNNPRDDYQYIKVTGVKKVKRVEVKTYTWEVQE